MSKSDLVEVKDVAQLVYLLSKWHQLKVLELEHMLKLPDGQKIEVITDMGETEETLILEGEALKGFKVGIYTALTHLGQLPIGVETETEDAPKQA